MDRPMSNLEFRFMSFVFWFRDIFLPPKKVLEEVGIKSGFSVLDYGCGTGSHTIVAAGLVGNSGKVYALDIHPLAVRQVRSMAAKKNLANVETIHSDCATGLPDGSVDIALLYDILHGLNEPDKVLEELYRVLKPGGTLSLSDHHMEGSEIIPRITDTGWFRLTRKGEKVYNFSKEQQAS